MKKSITDNQATLLSEKVKEAINTSMRWFTYKYARESTMDDIKKVIVDQLNCIYFFKSTRNTPEGFMFDVTIQQSKVIPSVFYIRPVNFYTFLAMNGHHVVNTDILDSLKYESNEGTYVWDISKQENKAMFIPNVRYTFNFKIDPESIK